ERALHDFRDERLAYRGYFNHASGVGLLRAEVWRAFSNHRTDLQLPELRRAARGTTYRRSSRSAAVEEDLAGASHLEPHVGPERRLALPRTVALRRSPRR